MPGANSLRGDFSDEHDGQGGADDSHQAWRQVIQDDSKGAVDGDVAEQDRAQEVVPVGTHRHDGTRVSTLRLCACEEHEIWLYETTMQVKL